jgi:hypothetical protein
MSRAVAFSCLVVYRCFRGKEGQPVNYGEALTYWYLRLIGFFPMTNFVLHRLRESHGQNADADLLAIRLPHVYEKIGGEHDDWDNARFGGWGITVSTLKSLRASSLK